MLDMNQSCGEKCKEQLDAEFGEGNCTFISCDVSNGDALKGNAADAVNIPSGHALLTLFQLKRELASTRKTIYTFIISAKQIPGLCDD